MLIYKITSKTTNKCYIGQTINSIDTRWKQHCKAKFGRFHDAIEEFGIDDWTFEILEIVSSKELLNERESYWIGVYNSYQDGYNGTPDGLFTQPPYREPTKKELDLSKEMRYKHLSEWWAKQGVIY